MKVKLLKIIGLVLPIVIMMVFSAFLLRNNFTAGLGMIDDHEIAMFLGNDGKINLSEVPLIMASTEVGKFGQSLRYRPSYYFLRIVESAWWQDNALFWYGFRYLMLVFSLVLGFKLMSRFFPKVISYLFVFYSLTMPFWPDLLTRLGPSEIYTVPGLMLFLYGLAKGKNWLLTIGYLICVGSKENFLFLLPIILGLFIYRVIKKKVNRLEIFSYILMIGYTFFIGASIVLATKTSGADVYGTSISYPERVMNFIKLTPHIVKSRHAYLSIATMTIYSIYLFFQSKGRNFKHLSLMVVISLVIVSQYILYNNSLPTNSRYDFPGIILFRILDLVAIAMILKSLEKTKIYDLAKTGIYLVMIVFMGYYIFTRGYTLILMASEKNARLSRDFSQKIELVARTLKNQPETKLVFISRHYIDFEPIVSVTRYLNSKGVGNEFYLDYTSLKIGQDDGLGNELNDRLMKVGKSEEEQEDVFGRFSVDKRGEEDSCYSISFQREYPNPCELITSF